MFKKIKNKIVKVMIEKAILRLLATFQRSNPKIYGWLVVALTVAQIALEYLVTNGIIPEGTSWLEWVFWFIAIFLGSKGVTAYINKDKLEEMEDDPVVAHARTQKEEINVLRDQNERLKEIIRNA